VPRATRFAIGSGSLKTKTPRLGLRNPFRFSLRGENDSREPIAASCRKMISITQPWRSCQEALKLPKSKTVRLNNKIVLQWALPLFSLTPFLLSPVDKAEKNINLLL
jgi:hypothetical protein